MARDIYIGGVRVPAGTKPVPRPIGWTPTYEADYDLCEMDADTLRTFTEAGLTVIQVVSDGPAGGNPCVTVRGPKAAHLDWISDHYHDGVSDAMTDEELWAYHQSMRRFTKYE